MTEQSSTRADISTAHESLLLRQIMIFLQQKYDRQLIGRAHLMFCDYEMECIM